MACRPIFVPIDNFPFVNKIDVNFKWYPGLAKTQVQKCIKSLHESSKELGIFPILEISSKSNEPLGVSLSAFNLMLDVNSKKISVECAYQGSKVFTKGGPFSELYWCSSQEAKKDERIRKSGELIGYRFFEEDFPIEPVSAFYDWLYLVALSQNETLAEELLKYKGFSDIAFNPNKSLNCQARAAALFVSLRKNNYVTSLSDLQDKSYYLNLILPRECSGSKIETLGEDGKKEESSQLELSL